MLYNAMENTEVPPHNKQEPSPCQTKFRAHECFALDNDSLFTFSWSVSFHDLCWSCNCYDCAICVNAVCCGIPRWLNIFGRLLTLTAVEFHADWTWYLVACFLHGLEMGRSLSRSSRKHHLKKYYENTVFYSYEPYKTSVKENGTIFTSK